MTDAERQARRAGLRPDAGPWSNSLYLRVCIIVVMAFYGGVFLGALAGAGVLGAAGAPFGMIFGAGVGVITSPIPVLCLMRKHLGLSAAIVYVPSGVVAYFFAAFTSFEAQFFGTCAVFAAACLACGLFLPNTWPSAPTHACQACDYDLRGLEGDVCPECGNSADRVTLRE